MRSSRRKFHSPVKVRNFGKALVGISVVGVVLAGIVGGCGGGDSATSGDSSTGGPSNSTKTTVSEGPNSEPSTEFISKGKGVVSQLPKFGKEADETEREAASRLLEENLQARAAGDWATQCESLAASIVTGIEEAAVTLGAGKGCAKGLEAQAAPTPESARANTMTGPIDALRVGSGGRGIALYHGTKGKDYAMPLIKEGGTWKVLALQEQELPQSKG
jgi:hypothetical protein